MPGVRKAVFVCTADWHLSHKPPACRSGEPDWMATQVGYLRQVRDIAGDLPVVCAGDVFDRHNPPTEVLNTFLMHSPKIYAVPGNHDLPSHRLADMERSGYFNCCLGKVIEDLDPDFPTHLDGKATVRAWAFPWGKEPAPCPEPNDLTVEIAVVHKFVYPKGGGYPGAPEDGLLGRFAEVMTGYDVVITGDNHAAFTQRIGNTTFVNCGSLVRRTADQKDYKPAVWVVYDDNTVEPRYLDVSKDAFDDSHLRRDRVSSEEVGRLADYLKGVRQDTADFDEAVKRVVRDKSIKRSVRDTLQELMDEP